MLNDQYLLWDDKVKHLGNIVCSTGTDLIECTRKKSKFIGYVNQLKSTYGNPQSDILMNLFKSYCCSVYGSILWKFNSVGFDKICKSWNTAIRILLHLPYNTHRCYLGYLIASCRLAAACYINASYTANTCIGYT